VLLSVLTLLLSACGADNTPTSQPTTIAATTAAATTVAATTAAASSSVAVKTVAPVPDGNRTGVTDTEIKLGASGPLTGGLAFLGTPIRVMSAYFKMINEQGGIYGRKINYITEDDAFDPAKSLDAIKKLIDQDQVLALTGVRSPAVPQLRDYLVQRKMPTIPFITSSTQLYEPPQKLIFGFLPPLTPDAKFAADYAIEQMHAKKLAILYQSDSFGRDALAPFVAEVQAKDGSVVAQLSVKSADQDQDVSGLLNTLQQSGADYLYIASGSIAPVVSFLQQLNNWSTKPKVMLSYYLSDPGFYQSLGKSAEGLYSSWFALPPENDDPKSVQFREFMKKYMPDEPINYYTQEGYIMGQIVVESLRRAGKDLSRETFVAAAESIVNWRDSYANNITFGPLNRSPINSVYVTQYQNGKLLKVSDWYTLK
jgi:branched-chain amino acid transport system substrate-binding protein